MNPSLRSLPLVLSAVLLGTHPAGAQTTTYRSVGPDGRIIFSDRKPTDPQLRTREVGKTAYAPLLTPTSEPFDLHPTTSVPHAPRPAATDGLAPPADASGRPFPPGLPDAILDVLVHQFFAQSLVETCSRVRPDSLERYQASVYNWRQRNIAILDKSNHVSFTRFTADQRDTLRTTGRARLAVLMPADNANDADRQAWCDRMSTDLARRQFELVSDARVAPLMAYQAP
jgi:hypothetical protein